MSDFADFMIHASQANLATIIAVKPSGDTTGVTDDTNINNAMTRAAARFGRMVLRQGTYYTAGAIRHQSGVAVELESGTIIRMRGKTMATVTAVNANTLTLNSTVGITPGMHVSDVAATAAAFQASGNPFGSIPYNTVVGAVAGNTITLVAGVGGAPVNPTGALASGINCHPRANVWTAINVSNWSLRCPTGWATLDGNWTEMYPFNANSDDAWRNCLRGYSVSDTLIEGIKAINAFYHGGIFVGASFNNRVPRWRSENCGYRSIHFHSEAIGGGDQHPPLANNLFGRIEMYGDGHRAFYTRNNDENNSGMFIAFQNCYNTQVQNVVAQELYGYTFCVSGGSVANWAGYYARNLQLDNIVQENCGMGQMYASNFFGAEVGNTIAWGKELSIASCVFYNTAAVLRYCVDATGTVRSYKTRLIDVPNSGGVGAIAAYGLRPGYRVYASGGSTGMNTITGLLIWECLVGTGAGGVDQIRVFRDDDGTQDPYTTAATVTVYVHGAKGDAITLYAASGETVNNIKFGNVLIQNCAFGIQTQAANGVYRYNDIDFGSVSIKRGYRLGINLSSIKGVNFNKLHTEDIASGFSGGGGGSAYDNYIQNCTGKVGNFTTEINTGFTTTNKALRLDSETRNLRVVPLSIKKPASGTLMIESLVTSGAPANSAGVAGPVTLENPVAGDGTPLTTAAGNISRVDATSCIITRPVDAA